MADVRWWENSHVRRGGEGWDGEKRGRRNEEELGEEKERLPSAPSHSQRPVVMEVDS